MSYTTYLAHHGIKGQKWGVRRFQKADGSLTAAGAKRYGIKGAMSAGRKVGSGLVKAARGGIQKVKEVKARKAAEKLERQKKVWAKTRLGLTMNADKFTVEELREANNRLDERDRAAKGLAEQVKRGVGYFQAIRDVTGAIKDTKDYIEDISGEKGKKAKAADELKYQRELEKEKRTYERDMVRDQLKANQEYEYKREKDKLDRESKEKIEKMKAKAKKKKESGGSDSDPEPDESPKNKSSRENTTEFEEVYWNSSKKDREFMETVFPKEVDEAKEQKKRRNKARREVDEAIRRIGFFGHSDISTYGGMMSTTVLTSSDISAYESYLAHHGIKGQKWGVRRFQNEDGTLTKAGMKRAGYKFKTLRKNATASRILIDENEDTSNLDRAYFSTNNLDNQKWANYFASIGAQYLDKSAYSINFKTKKKLIIARGEEISKVASKLMDKDDTFRKEFEATKQKQIQSTGSEEAWESLSESAKYSAMIAYKCEGGKKIIGAMKDIGFDGVEDLFGKDVSKDPIIIFNPGSNLRQVGQKQELKGLYRGYRKYYGLPINHSSFSCNNISNNAGGSNQMFMNDDLLAYGAYLEHHGIKGQKWGVRRFQNPDGTRISSRIRSSIQARRYSSELNKLERKKKKSVDRMLREYNKIRSLMNEAKKYSTTKPMRALKLLDKGESRLKKYEQIAAEDEKFEDEIIKKQKAILSDLKKDGFEYTAPSYRVKLGADKSIKFVKQRLG